MQHKKLIGIVLILIAQTCYSKTQVLAIWDVAGVKANSSEIEVLKTNKGLSASKVHARGVHLDAVDDGTTTGMFISSGWPAAKELDFSKFYEFSVTLNKNLQMELESVNANICRFSNPIFTGPETWVLMASLDGFNTHCVRVGKQSISHSPSGSPTEISFETSVLGRVSNTITFRLYGFNGGAGPAGFMNIDGSEEQNLMITGTILADYPTNYSSAKPTFSDIEVSSQGGRYLEEGMIIFPDTTPSGYTPLGFPGIGGGGGGTPPPEVPPTNPMPPTYDPGPEPPTEEPLPPTETIVVPEPGLMGLLCTGAVAMLWRRRKVK